MPQGAEVLQRLAQGLRQGPELRRTAWPHRGQPGRSGLQNAGKNLTTASFIKGLEQIKDYEDVFGSPKTTVNAEQHQGSSESFLTVIKNGRWVPVSEKLYGY